MNGLTKGVDLAPLMLNADGSIFSALTAIESGGRFGLPSGIALVVDADQHLVGVITDGDIRDALLHGSSLDTPIREAMTTNPIAIHENFLNDDPIAEIRRQMEVSNRQRSIRHALVVDSEQHVVGFLDVTQLMQSQYLHHNSVAVIGLGFVGITLALTLAEVGLDVYGWDVSEPVRDLLKSGKSHVMEVGIDRLLKLQLERETLHIASDYEDLANCGVFIVAVNTPVHDGVPVLDYVEAATRELCRFLKPGSLVVLRSTVLVGTCRNVVQRIIEEETDYRVGRDIGLAFAPERTVQGKALAELRALPQVIGGAATSGAAKQLPRSSPG